MNSRYSKIVATIIILILLGAFQARADDWVLLGKRTVKLVSERDEIDVKGFQGTFKRIKIKVRDRGVEFHNVYVVFGTGPRFEVPMRDFIPAGGETRAIDLPGDKRVIRKIIFLYKTRPGSSKRATVEVWGLRD